MPFLKLSFVTAFSRDNRDEVRSGRWAEQKCDGKGEGKQVKHPHRTGLKQRSGNFSWQLPAAGLLPGRPIRPDFLLASSFLPVTTEEVCQMLGTGAKLNFQT